MILDNQNNDRPEIDYPCEWKYKLIAANADDAVNSAEKAASGFKYDITASNISKKGKYVSINLSVEVESEEERNLIFTKLEADDKIVMVI